jgi:hypothetical protein
MLIYSLPIFILLGSKPPSPLARFQNQVTGLEKTLEDNIGLNNKRVWPATERRRGLSMGGMFRSFESPTPTARIEALSKNLKTQMQEQKVGYLTRDPENPTGH